jgi:hypothetical protein
MIGANVFAQADKQRLEKQVSELAAEVKLLREAYDALISMDHYHATKYNPRSAAAIAALEAFDSSRDPNKGEE